MGGEREGEVLLWKFYTAVNYAVNTLNISIHFKSLSSLLLWATQHRTERKIE